MEPHFTTAFFVNNRRKLRTLFTGKAPIILTANGVMQRSGDTTYRFRQDSNFWYLTGVDEPDLILVLDKDKEYLILPADHELRIKFDAAATSEELALRSGIDQVLMSDAGWKQLSSRLKKVAHVATLGAPPAYLQRYNFYTNPARAVLIKRLKEVNPSVELLDLKDHFTAMRAVKQDQELEALQAAIDITSKALKKVHRRLTRYTTEAQIAADLMHSFTSLGAAGHAFDPIVASGTHATSLHYQANNQPLQKNTFIVIDIGAEVSNYAADITRSYSYGKLNRRQQLVYAAVEEVYDFALAKVKPGMILRDYEEEVEHFMGEKLRELGLIKSIDRPQVRRYYPQYTSHYLGLEAHDVGDYEKPLQANMVITIEPGIYIPEEGIGIRIEDDVLVTTKGYKILSNKLPRKLS